MLDEPFDALLLRRWTFTDDGDQAGPSQWTVVSGELHQTSSIVGTTVGTNSLEAPGTYAIAGNTSWPDYRFTASLASDDANGAIGVIFRYQDANNYYRFSMGADPNPNIRMRGTPRLAPVPRYRRLIKKAGGVVTVLWEDTVPYMSARMYLLTIDCIGKSLTGYLDGNELFKIVDGDLLMGAIGLYCSSNPGARFGEVRVAAPSWAEYYTFGDETRYPAGTRVRVYAGNVADMPSDGDGKDQRFVALLDDRGRLRLPTAGSHLRLQTPNGATAHERQFLPDADYRPIDGRVVRKADGTGFFIMSQPSSQQASQLPTGEYRLKLTYRRNNQAVEPDSPLLSESGSKADEDVRLDVPWDSH